MDTVLINPIDLLKYVDHKYPDSLPTKAGEVLFVHPDTFTEFVEKHLESIQVPFTLLTHGSDYTFPYHFRKHSFKVLRHPNLIQWYAQNCVEPTEKLKQIPIGLIIHDDLFEKTNELPRLNKILGNFHFQMKTYLSYDRQEAIEKIPKDLIDYQEERLPLEDLIQKMASYKFIASPFGNGFDCHRTWEALAIGCIPIVRSSGLDPLYKGLPVLIVKDWADVTQELLDSFSPDRTAMEKLKLSYWVGLLKTTVV
jgi:hypothetical protein